MAFSITTGHAAPQIGIRVPPWAPYLRGIYPGVLGYLSHRSAWRLETAEDSTQEIPPSFIDENWTGNGLIVFRCTSRELTAWTSRGIRVVNISSEMPSSSQGRLAAVMPDNRGIGRAAAEHLLSRGLQHFACWHDPTRRYSCERLAGFSERLRQAGLDATVLGMPVSETPFQRRWRAIEAVVRDQVPRLPIPTGLFAKDDISAAAIIRVCDRMGRRVPEELAVIGCNNDPAHVYTTVPSLTSVDYPGTAIGTAAAAMLDRMLREPAWIPAQPHLVPSTDVVERQSTMVFGFDDSLVSEVWTLLQQQATHRPLKVRDLARALAVSEPTLRRRFRNATGRNVKSVIDEYRLRRIEHALRHTDSPVTKIAYDFGFLTPEEFSRFLKRCTGESPSRWRAQNRPAVS